MQPVPPGRVPAFPKTVPAHKLYANPDQDREPTSRFLSRQNTLAMPRRLSGWLDAPRPRHSGNALRTAEWLRLELSAELRAPPFRLRPACPIRGARAQAQPMCP